MWLKASSVVGVVIALFVLLLLRRLGLIDGERGGPRQPAFLVGTPLPASPTRKSVRVAVLLQCVPLLGAGSCVLLQATPDRVLDAGGDTTWLLVVLLYLTELLWGLGYWYLGRTDRALLALVLGPVFAVGSCVVVVALPGEGCSNVPPGADCPEDYTWTVEHAAVIAAGTALVAADAWRLAEAPTAGIEVLPEPRPRTPRPMAPSPPQPAGGGGRDGPRCSVCGGGLGPDGYCWTCGAQR